MSEFSFVAYEALKNKALAFNIIITAALTFVWTRDTFMLLFNLEKKTALLTKYAFDDFSYRDMI